MADAITHRVTRLPDGRIRIWPADPINRVMVACRHWSPHPSHLASGYCAAGQFKGRPVLGACLIHCPQYTGSAAQRADQVRDMLRHYATPGEIQRREATSLISQSRDAAPAQRQTMLADAANLLRQADDLDRPWRELHMPRFREPLAFNPATERRGCCDPPPDASA